jgi:hypothetical protein
MCWPIMGAAMGTAMSAAMMDWSWRYGNAYPEMGEIK